MNLKNGLITDYRLPITQRVLRVLTEPLEQHQTLSHPESHRFGPTLDSQLGEDRGYVELDGMKTDVEADGNLLVGEAFGHLLEDFPFTRGKDINVGRSSSGGDKGRSEQGKGGGAIKRN